MYTCIMKISDMPSWATKYKGRNKSLKYLGNDRYGLYEVTSKYDSIKGYSKSIQTFIGVISKDEGLVLKKKRVNDKADYLEYGLSHFLYLNFKRNIQRSIGKGDSKYIDYLIKLIIVKYVFGQVYDEFIDMTYLCLDRADEIKEYKNKISDKRINNGANRINTYLSRCINDDKDLNLLINYLRLINIRDTKDINIYVNDDLKGLLDKYDFKF